MVIGISVRACGRAPLCPVPHGVVAILPEADAGMVDGSQLPRRVVGVARREAIRPLKKSPPARRIVGKRPGPVPGIGEGKQPSRQLCDEDRSAPP